MVSISCYVINDFQQRVLSKSAKPKVIQHYRMMLRPIIPSTDESLAALAFVWVVIFLRLLKRLFFILVSVCAVFKWFPLIFKRIWRKSLNPGLFWLIVDVFVCLWVCVRVCVCVCLCVCVFGGGKGGGDLRGCQKLQDASEHVRTRETEAPARLTDTILTSDASTSQAHKQQHVHKESDGNTQGTGDI